MPTPVTPPPGHEDVGLQRISFQEFFRTAGPPVHVNHPTHQGDIPLHDHDFTEIALVLAGHGVHRTIHGLKPIRRGDCLVIQQGRWHAYEQAHGLQLYNLCFGTNLLLRELAWVRSDPVLSTLFPGRFSTGTGRHADQGVVALALDNQTLAALSEELERIRALQFTPDVVKIRAEIIGRLILALGHVGRAALGDRAVGPSVELSSGGPVAAAVQALEEQLEKEWSLDELAALCDLNRSYFVRRFRRATGLSPMAYLARRRAEKAAVLLLTTEMPIAEVGRRVGWHDPNYFARRFRHAFGMNARTYREQLPTPPLARDEPDWLQW